MSKNAGKFLSRMEFAQGTVLKSANHLAVYHTFYRVNGGAYSAPVPVVAIVLGALVEQRIGEHYRTYLLFVNNEFVTEYMQHMHTWEVLKEGNSCSTDETAWVV